MNSLDWLKDRKENFKKLAEIERQADPASGITIAVWRHTRGAEGDAIDSDKRAIIETCFGNEELFNILFHRLRESMRNAEEALRKEIREAEKELSDTVS